MNLDVSSESNSHEEVSDSKSSSSAFASELLDLSIKLEYMIHQLATNSMNQVYGQKFSFREQKKAEMPKVAAVK